MEITGYHHSLLYAKIPKLHIMNYTNSFCSFVTSSFFAHNSSVINVLGFNSLPPRKLQCGINSTQLEMIPENIDQFSVLVNEHGWQVRRMNETEDEMRKVARVQAEAFHQPSIFFDHLFFDFFQAEVLSGLLNRLRNSPPNRYACLVAEQRSNECSSEIGDVVGVVGVTVLRDGDVLQHLMGGEEYLYISGIAVLTNFRRQKVGTALLKACDIVGKKWGLEYIVLRAYEDDLGARNLYSIAGYNVVAGDPTWVTTWLGRRRRILMLKKI